MLPHVEETDPLISAVPTAQGSDNECPHRDAVSFARQLICQGLILRSFLLLGSIECIASIPKWDADVYDGDAAVIIIANDDVWS